MTPAGGLVSSISMGAIMTFDPNPDRHDQILSAPLIEFMGIQPARDADDKIVAVITFRFSPAVSFSAKNYCLTQLQAIRLRDDLDSLLTTPSSWLYTGKE